MPELPEVETIARDLAALLRNRRFLKLRYDRKPPVFDAASLSPKLLVGRAVLDVGRVGKYVLIELGDDLRLAVHLRMTGRLLYRNGERTAAPYARAQFELDNGDRLVFTDVRKFGRMRLFRGDARIALGVGIDPFAPELSASKLGDLLARSKTPVKVWLLNQKRLAGVGNIYACESLFFARLRPQKKAAKLSRVERERLLASLRLVLRKAIRNRGSSVDDYVDAEGKEGEFQKQLAVYGRAGMPCRRCGTPIRRILLAQRSTFYCPVCQR